MSDVKQKNVVAIIPARAGSKRLPSKNTLLFCGKPLIAWTIEAAQQAQCIAQIIISTDDPAVLEIAKEYDCAPSFMRPSELATDDASSMDVVRHALRYAFDGIDTVILLQPTSPLRGADDIDKAYDIFMKEKASSVVSFTKVKKPSSWFYGMDGGRLQSLNLKTDQLIYPNGAIYIRPTEGIMTANEWVTKETAPCIMAEEKSVDIDTAEDFNLAEFYYKEWIKSDSVIP